MHPEAVELVERLVWHHDQPFGDSSAVPTFLLNEVARDHVTVALSGDGGDELFAGYERFAGRRGSIGAGACPHRSAGWAQAVDALPAAAFRGRVGSAQRLPRAAEQGMPTAYLSGSATSPSAGGKIAPAADDWAIETMRAQWQRPRARSRSTGC